MTQPTSAHASPDPKSTDSVHTLTDPFASPLATPLQRPVPCVQSWTGIRHSRDLSASGQRHDSLTPGSYQSSFSSMGSTTTAATPHSGIDLEKGALQDEFSSVCTANVRDPEKEAADGQTRHHNARHSRRYRPSPPASEIISLTYREDEAHTRDGRALQESKAPQILVFLSGPCVVLSMLNLFWAFISILITICTQPVRLCATRPSFGLQLAGLLGPTLNLQLRAIYTPMSPHANEDGSYHIGWLLLVHILSPFISFITMFLAWVVAAYWGVSKVVGDPAGVDKRDDGRDTVLGLRKWWESFLLKAVQGDFCTALS